MRLTLNVSPCPNDTFMFDAIVNRRIDIAPFEFDVRYLDIEQLNAAVLEGGPAISKISYAVLPAITERYRVLDSGSALGRGNGPLLVSRGEVNPHKAGLRVAVPGMHTTANVPRTFQTLSFPFYLLLQNTADLHRCIFSSSIKSCSCSYPNRFQHLHPCSTGCKDSTTHRYSYP